MKGDSDMAEPDGRPAAHRRLDRWVNVAFGLLFIGVAAAVVYYAADAYPVGAGAVALVTGSLGIDALVSAARNRRSLASRIGPLP